MTEQEHSNIDEELVAWTKKTTDKAVYELIDQGAFDNITVEAKAAWVLPFTLIIGRVREQGQGTGFDWFICGDAPLTRVHSSVAATPKDAAKHFAMQWHLDASRQGEAGSALVEKAEALYQLLNDSELWK